MSSFGNKLAECRKAKNLSQKELAEIFSTSHTTIGKYERNEVVPSVEIATKIADALAVSLDFLVGKSSLIVKDTNILERLEDIEKLPDADKQNIFYTLDNLIKAAKLKAI